ncbi:MAG: peptigoglycan-binding protein LysM, partial [Planctomycetes bacterium]|nr:peptigoglycan-binding protein LysM [Planctomycetota bacterium]
MNDQMKRRARCYYGDGNKWRLIYEANAKEIADVKDLPV